MFDTPDGASERETIRHRMRPAFNERFTNRNPHLMDRLIEWRLEQDAGAPARGAQAAAVQKFDVSDRLDGLRVPTLLLHGTDDQVVPVENARLLEEKISDSRLELVEGGSHLFFIEDDELVNEHLLAFLDEQGDEGSRLAAILALLGRRSSAGCSGVPDPDLTVASDADIEALVGEPHQMSAVGRASLGVLDQIVERARIHDVVAAAQLGGIGLENRGDCGDNGLARPAVRRIERGDVAVIGRLRLVRRIVWGGHTLLLSRTRVATRLPISSY